MGPVLINGKSYTHAQIVANIGGVPVAGVTKISYKESQEKKNNYGTGTRPVSRGHGIIEAEGSITLSMNEVEAIRDTAPDGSLLKIPAFDITITFLNDQKIVNHVLKNVEFTSDGVESSTGDMDLVNDIGLAISHINYRP